LRAALPHLRESSSTLGQEVALARAYLDIMCVRLGDRLAFSIDVAASDANARMPPMMLLPLIDHALTYGLRPGARDGHIRIATRVANGRLRLEIDDSGVAFVPGGNAEAFANIAQRLEALYGAQAHLDLERTADLGTRAVLEMPHEDAYGHRR
jgi:LytS/YehU family sensor histidine kinase